MMNPQNQMPGLGGQQGLSQQALSLQQAQFACPQGAFNSQYPTSGLGQQTITTTTGGPYVFYPGAIGQTQPAELPNQFAFQKALLSVLIADDVVWFCWAWLAVGIFLSAIMATTSMTVFEHAKNVPWFSLIVTSSYPVEISIIGVVALRKYSKKWLKNLE